MRATADRLRVFFIAAAVALLGYLLAGCDGAAPALQPDSGQLDGAGQRADGGVSKDVVPSVDVVRLDGTTAGDAVGPAQDGLLVRCDIPSPTGDQATWYGKARDLPAANRVLVSGSVREVCEAWKAAYPASGMMTPDPAAVVGIDCSDAANDFQGSSGRPWSVYAVDPDGTPCSATASKGSCAATQLLEMPRYQSSDPQKRWYVRSWALCTPAGAFAGWLYTVS